MKNVRKASLQIFFALALIAAPLVAFQLKGTEAFAQSSFFTSSGCVDCHSAPTVATCAGCHKHSGTLIATKNKTTSYAPGETVTITLTASGARSGWIGVRLYNQSGVEIARSTGNQSGMGGSATFGALSAVSAPAPAMAGTYNWRIAYLGNVDGNSSGDVHSEKSVTVPVTVASVAPPADTAAPVVSFTLPATATSLTVPVSSLSATDNVAVTGYLINKVATPPAATATGWTASAPTSVTAAVGSNTFYAWAKDAAGNVSAVKSASVTIITAPDAPTNVTATAGNGLAAVSFTPPVFNGGSPIATYTVTATPGNITATGSSSPITVTGLTNSLPYTFTVTAKNVANLTSQSASASTNLYGLSVTINGTGGGSVNSITLSGINCTNGTCASSFNSGSLISLAQSASNGSQFSGWGGACTGIGPCDVLLSTLNQSVTATFASVPNARIFGNPKLYGLLQLAYNDAPTGAVIQIQGTTLVENLVLNEPKDMILRGGFDPSFSTQGIRTTIQGTLAIRQGRLAVSYLTIK